MTTDKSLLTAAADLWQNAAANVGVNATAQSKAAACRAPACNLEVDMVERQGPAAQPSSDSSNSSTSSDSYMQLVDKLIEEGMDCEDYEDSDEESSPESEDVKGKGLVRHFSAIVDPQGPPQAAATDKPRTSFQGRCTISRDMDRVDSALSYGGTARRRWRKESAAVAPTNVEGGEGTSLYTAPAPAIMSPFGSIPEVMTHTGRNLRELFSAATLLASPRSRGLQCDQIFIKILDLRAGRGQPSSQPAAVGLSPGFCP
jgi:hypothetical protein